MVNLALKYRPKTFDDLVEQNVIKKILQYQLEEKIFKQAYLFTGGAGTGKTTAARIFANDINNGKGTPIEIDAASNNGVDDVREIIDNAKFKALDAEHKVYIIDEVHMLSTGAWNAMLKLIEEPPARTVFIFCTTDPQKIPATIMSRVQRFDFRRISDEAIISRLMYIINAENTDIINENCGSLDAVVDIEWAVKEGIPVILYEESALNYIATIADGGMRDAITLLDKCLSFDKNLSVDNVIAVLGVVDHSKMTELTVSILSDDTAGVIEIMEQTHQSGVDIKQFMRQYCTFILGILKTIITTPNPHTIETWTAQAGNSAKALVGLTEPANKEGLLIILETLIKLNADIKWETNPKPLVEATLILLSRGDKWE